MAEFKVIGKRVPAINASEMVSGAAIYGTDVVLPRMLHGKILRSPHAHARIMDIDTRRAERVPGVRGIATWKDAPDAKFGPSVQDERLLAKDEVHYIGDEVAAVAALDEDTAAEALELIQEQCLPPYRDLSR
jgi:CO/xanthine dehydrogenase Mo-binding subunit